jgi:hypothetical protein
MPWKVRTHHAIVRSLVWSGRRSGVLRIRFAIHPIWDLLGPPLPSSPRFRFIDSALLTVRRGSALHDRICLGADGDVMSRCEKDLWAFLGGDG